MKHRYNSIAEITDEEDLYCILEASGKHMSDGIPRVEADKLALQQWNQQVYEQGELFDERNA